MARITKAERQEAIEKLRKWLPVGTTVYCIVRKVSASGMSRNISLVYFEDGDDRHPTYVASKALGWPMANKGPDAIKVSGCEMDMCFHTVYTLSQILHGDGNALKYRTL